MNASNFGRRKFLKTVADGAGMAVPAWPAHAASATPAEPGLTSPVPAGWQSLHLEKGRHLFVDDFLVGSAQGLKATLHHPKKLGQPVLMGIGTPNDNFQPFMTVLHDKDLGRFRMWYNTRKVMRGGHTYVS